jgi:hypothetical protein
MLSSLSSTIMTVLGIRPRLPQSKAGAGSSFCLSGELTSICYEKSNGAKLDRLKPASLNLESLADLCLGFLAENPEELGNFMGQAGLSPETLRSSMGSREFAMGLVDYFASNEPLLLALCANASISPEQFMRLWYKLNPAG